jgi:hypothetical protein
MQRCSPWFLCCGFGISSVNAALAVFLGAGLEKNENTKFEKVAQLTVLMRCVRAHYIFYFFYFNVLPEIRYYLSDFARRRKVSETNLGCVGKSV